MPQLDPAFFAPQLIWLGITFTVLYMIMSRVALPRIGSVIDERRDRVEGDLAAANELKENTAAAIAAYERALAEARGRAHGIVNQTRAELTEKLNAEKASAEQETAAKTAKAEAGIQDIRQKSLEQVERIASEVTQALVEKLINMKVDTAAAHAAVSQVSRPSAGSSLAE
jgi:F-type H+-transporting ATPase subunit b